MNRMGEPRLRIRIILERETEYANGQPFWLVIAERRAFEGYASFQEGDQMLLDLQPAIGEAINKTTAPTPIDTADN